MSPEIVSQDEYLRVLRHIGPILVRKFTFPGTEADDVLQLIALWSWEALPRFRPEIGSLDSYLYSHCRNRLTNKARDEVTRSDAPCQICLAEARGHGPGHPDGPCHKNDVWQRRNRSKATINSPRDLSFLSDEHEARTQVASAAEQDAIGSELSRLIDDNLPITLRKSYLQMLAGVQLPGPKKRAVQRAVTSIIGDESLMPCD